MKIMIRRIIKKIKLSLLNICEHILPGIFLNYCNICERKTIFVYGCGISGNAALKKYQVIGCGRRKHAVCPHCQSIDRYRWVWYVMEHLCQIEKGAKVLHFAPEIGIEKNIRDKIGDDNYYTGDITPGRAKYVLDITDIRFEDGLFDVVIANHILEHIKDENKAIKELIRVTKPGGKILLSTPISFLLEKTIEDTRDSLTDEERLERFGQQDHVRIHGRDFKSYLQSFGLNMHEYVVSDILPKREVSKMALIPQDRVYMLRKSCYIEKEPVRGLR